MRKGSEKEERHSTAEQPWNAKKGESQVASTGLFRDVSGVLFDFPNRVERPMPVFPTMKGERC